MGLQEVIEIASEVGKGAWNMVSVWLTSSTETRDELYSKMLAARDAMMFDRQASIDADQRLTEETNAIIAKAEAEAGDK